MKINIYDILFWIIFIIAVITALWYIFGDSPTFEQTILILIAGFLFKIQGNIIFNSLGIKSLKRKFNIIEKSFIRLASDFKNHVKHN